MKRWPEQRHFGFDKENHHDRFDLAQRKFCAQPAWNSMHGISPGFPLDVPYALVDVLDGRGRDRCVRSTREVWAVIQGALRSVASPGARFARARAAMVVSHAIPGPLLKGQVALTSIPLFQRQMRSQKFPACAAGIGRGTTVTGMDVPDRPGTPSVGMVVASLSRSLATWQILSPALAKMSDSDGNVGTTTTEVIPPTHFPIKSDDALSRLSVSIAAARSRS